MYSEDVNFHLQSLRDAPPPPIMYTGIIYPGNPEEDEEEEEAKERNNAPASPSLSSITHHRRAVYTKETSPTARPIRELSIMQNFVEAGLIFRRRIYRSAY